jgi:hypothetical protein
MNTKIMGLHTKLTNLVFHEIDRHLDRLNMNEEPVNNCSPENQHQKLKMLRCQTILDVRAQNTI